MSAGLMVAESRGVCVNYGAVRALDGVSMAVSRGEFVAVLGPNGSGKSSLLRCLAGLLIPDAGAVFLNAQPMSGLTAIERARAVAFAPQSLESLPGVSAFEFVLSGRYAHLGRWRLFSEQDRAAAREALRQTDALQFEQRPMGGMSGGERQRVVLARALCQQTPLIVLDEPTSALDLQHQLKLCGLMRELVRLKQRTLVVATHDLNLASQFADRIVLLKLGRVAGEGSPEQVLTESRLRDVYEVDVARGYFEETLDGRARPWVLPWARKPASDKIM